MPGDEQSRAPDPSAKRWFITGCSKGFGRVWTEAALERGDAVAATARDEGSLADLSDRHGERFLPMRLDVTDKEAVDEVVRRAHERLGRLDVVVNNAGYGLFGTIEEISEAEARSQMETNFFGALWVTKAALPLLRAQRSGHFLQISSVAGINAHPMLGLYHASKWALEAFSQSLAAEVREFGIKVTLVEPTGYHTDWSGPSSVRAAPIAAYDEARAGLAAHFEEARSKPRSPRATCAAIFRLVDARDPPLRILFGEGPLDRIRAEYAERISLWERWNEVSREAEHST